MADSDSDQTVQGGITGSGGSGGDLDFAVDRGQVSLDGTQADDELFGDLSIRQSLRNATQHLDFAGGEPIGLAG